VVRKQRGGEAREEAAVGLGSSGTRHAGPRRSAARARGPIRRAWAVKVQLSKEERARPGEHSLPPQKHMQAASGAATAPGRGRTRTGVGAAPGRVGRRPAPSTRRARSQQRWLDGTRAAGGWGCLAVAAAARRRCHRCWGGRCAEGGKRAQRCGGARARPSRPAGGQVAQKRPSTHKDPRPPGRGIGCSGGCGSGPPGAELKRP
jgi:hypothetical protein